MGRFGYLSLHDSLKEVERLGISPSLLVDTHAHLTDPSFSDDEVLELLKLGVKVLSLTVNPSDLNRIRRWLSAFPPEALDNLFLALGVHPHEASNYSPEEVLKFLNEGLSDPLIASRVVAIGEVGLDFYYNFSEPRDQYRVLEVQVELALERGLPISFHSRESEEELLKLIRDLGVTKGVLHSYTGSPEVAWKSVELGFFIGVNGIVTFKRAEELRALVKELPMNKLLIETDSPYLSPVPFRGKRNNPLLVSFVGRALAELKGFELSRALQILKENALELFSLWKDKES